MPDSLPEKVDLVETTSAGQVVEQTGQDTAGSPAADVKGKSEPESMLEAVKAALSKDKAPEASPASADGRGKDGEEAAEGEDPAGEDLPDEVTDEELRGYHSRTRRRIRKLLDKNRELAGQIEGLSEKAQRFDGITAFVENARLTTEEVNAGFEIMRLMKHDPEKALNALVPYVLELQRITGATLSDDLRQAVEQGMITEDAARELSRHRSRESLAQAEARRASEAAARQSEERRRADEAAELTDTVASAISEWENTVLAKDPDREAKHPLVESEIERLILKAKAEGKLPRTAQEAVAMAEKAYAEVNKRVRLFAPKPREIRTVTSGSVAAATPTPSTELDAARAAVRAMRA